VLEFGFVIYKFNLNNATPQPSPETKTKLLYNMGVNGHFFFPGHKIAYIIRKTAKMLCEISSSLGSEYEAQNLMGCTAVFLIECRPTFQRYMLPPSSP
jgi:hypothetical protein